MSKFWSPFVKDLVPYVPGEQPKLAKLVKLNTNENPYGPSPKALAAMQAELNDNLRLYPDPNSDLLKKAVAEYYGVQSNQVFLGNGSDEVLAHIFHGLLQHDQPLLFPDISYSFYPVYCGLYGIRSMRCRWTSSSRSTRRTTPSRTAGSFSPTRMRRPVACWRWTPSSRSSRPARIRWSWWMRPTSTSAAKRRSAWWTVIRTCW
jgi:hypothetical protein